MLSNDAAYRAAREILRFRYHPQRLRDNQLVRLWSASALAAPCEDAALVAALNRDLADAIAALPERRSQLLRRCDLDGEAPRGVMEALGLSERHYYRERRAAIAELGNRLQHPATRHAISIDGDPLALHLVRADALERAGRTDDALAVLSHVRANTATENAARIDVRLAEVSRDAGRFAEAAGHAWRARSSARGDAVEEFNALNATIAWQAGSVACRDDGLQESIDRLRDRANRRTFGPIPHALCDLLEMSAEAALEAGDWRRGVMLFEEARASLERMPEPRADVLVRSLIWLATARSWIAGGLPVAVSELESAYAMACARSLPLGRLCQILDLGGNAKRALELATAHLEPAAGELIGDWRASAHLDVASTYISANRFAQARTQLQEAQSCAPPGSFAGAAAMMHGCEIDLALRDAPGALASSRAALAEMERLERSRHVGVVLAVRAEALWMLGRRRDAAAEMHRALDLMARHAHPVRLAVQYRRAERVTGNRDHGRLGREIWRAHVPR